MIYSSNLHLLIKEIFSLRNVNIYLFVYLFIYLLIYSLIYLLIYTFICLVIYLWIYFFIYLIIYLLLYLFVYMYIYLFIYLWIYLFIYLFISNMISTSNTKFNIFPIMIISQDCHVRQYLMMEHWKHFKQVLTLFAHSCYLYPPSITQIVCIHPPLFLCLFIIPSLISLFSLTYFINILFCEVESISLSMYLSLSLSLLNVNDMYFW